MGAATRKKFTVETNRITLRFVIEEVTNTRLLQRIVWFILLATAFSLLNAQAFAQGTGSNEVQTESPVRQPVRKLTSAEHQQEIAEFYSQLTNHEVILDLENPDGIDPSLLPDSIASLVDENTKIVAYKETRRQDSPNLKAETQEECKAESSEAVITPMGGDISCTEHDGTLNATISSAFGGVEQYVQVIGWRYDWYPPCNQQCYGWEIDNHYGWWTRSNSSWDIDEAELLSYIYGENYCTESIDTINQATYPFDPAWQTSTKTYTYSLSGLPDKAVVPFTQGWSDTISDVYQYSSLHTDEATTRYVYPRG